jgi:hypothetical protein
VSHQDPIQPRIYAASVFGHPHTADKAMVDIPLLCCSSASLSSIQPTAAGASHTLRLVGRGARRCRRYRFAMVAGAGGRVAATPPVASFAGCPSPSCGVSVFSVALFIAATPVPAPASTCRALSDCAAGKPSGCGGGNLKSGPKLKLTQAGEAGFGLVNREAAA